MQLSRVLYWAKIGKNYHKELNIYSKRNIFYDQKNH